MDGINCIPENTCDIERLTHLQIRRHIEKSPAVILPLGGCEPFGGAGEVGAESACVLEVARELSQRCKILVAPLIPLGCSSPFIAFSGAAGVKPRTFVNMLCEVLNAYVFQGISRIFLVSAAPFNREPAAEALRRVEEKHRGAVKTAFFDLNTVLCGDGGRDFDRDDGLILSVLSYIRHKSNGIDGIPNAILDDAPCMGGRPRQPEIAGINVKNVDPNQYKTWKRRGRDPQKFRAICPDGLILSPDNNEITPACGKEYFDRIVNAIHEKIKFVTARVALSLGSNLGDRASFISSMERMLRGILLDVRVSPLMETEPVGVDGPQPPYLNRVITGYFSGSPRMLLVLCQTFESELGRTRESPRGPRTADIDILLFDDLRVDDVSARPHTLVIPHPELLNRRFCLEGLAAIDPGITVPLSGGGRTVGELCENMDAKVAAQNVSLIVD
ncbi:MAG: 2-amino-4-hydroxy-6-hydroxymethyldihydropteridine diphosphokinase [Chitinispirillia bacterium]|nr:2-amino-4-hydroxy-6-hydroxymethyldihydropteridine diphosphokinase [Chitinispirillia bacterium]